MVRLMIFVRAKIMFTQHVVSSLDRVCTREKLLVFVSVCPCLSVWLNEKKRKMFVCMGSVVFLYLIVVTVSLSLFNISDIKVSYFQEV